MAPSRGKGKGKARATVTPAGRPPADRGMSRSTRATRSAATDMYADMLAEAAVTDPDDVDAERPLKRRRVTTALDVQGELPRRGPAKRPLEGRKQEDERVGRNLQTIEASSASDESDFDFEDVDLKQPAPATSTVGSEAEDDLADVTVSVDDATTPKRRERQSRRKPASVAEKAQRLLTHKAHVICLIAHCIYVNSWCSNEIVHRNLENTLNAKIKLYLNPTPNLSQFDKDRSFMNGLREASTAFRGAYRITASSMHRSDGNDEGSGRSDVEPMDRADFIAAAKKLQGSQDTGNQLFCALLRSVGVEARLVFSLQPLSLSGVPSKPRTPVKPAKPVVFAIASDTDPMASDASADDAGVKSSTSVGQVPSVRRRLGQPSFKSAVTPPPARQQEQHKRHLRKLTYPLFWIEAFNAAHQKWIPVDPLVTQTLNKPSKLEPPSSYGFNQMKYVIAHEADGVAKDVTRRYAKAYNAKTRRARVESTESGALWLRRALRFLRRRGPKLDRDQVEDADLAQKEAREGLPTNVVDFKDHPYYALERHLQRHEVVHPRREVGRVNAGTARNPRMEAVLRRQDVVACRSADKWFRVGREVKQGEQPLKRVPARRRIGQAGEDGEAEVQSTTALYAPFQTTAYVPPPVVDGRVPRNAFGNLDVYVPSMVPAGGVHVRHSLAKEAAALLKVDFVDAVTGFSFKGRQGTAIVEGGIVARECGEAVVEAIGGLLEVREEERCRQRSLVALRLWKRFLTGLRIHERVAGYGGEKSKGEKMTDEVQEDVDAQTGPVNGGVSVLVGAAKDVDNDPPLLTAGQYTIEELLAPPISAAKPARKRKEIQSEEEEEGSHWSPGVEAASSSKRVTRSRRRAVIEEDDDEDDGDGNGGGFLAEDLTAEDGRDGGFLRDGNADVEEDDGTGGGFVPEADDAEMEEQGGGGFVPEDAGDIGDGSAGGGFLASTEQGGGGFMPEDAGLSDQEGQSEEQGASRQQSEAEWRHDRSASDGVEHKAIAHATASSPEGDTTMSESHALPAARIDEAGAQTDVAVPAQLPVSTTTHTKEDDNRSSVACSRGAGRAHENVSAVANEGSAADESSLKDPLVDNDGAAGAEQDDDDAGSLMSHDPEDEDAEPDWLESD